MDLNLTVLCGRLATDPEFREFDSGTRLIRYLITVRTDHPRRRVDVIPVVLWDPPPEILVEPGYKGERVWACGSAQRRYWESADGRRSRVEIVAEQVVVGDLEDLEPIEVQKPS